MRKFNVYSPCIHVAEGETFHWVLDSAEGASVEVKPVTTWQLTEPSYTVTSATPATVAADPAAKAEFTCDPPPSNVSNQEIVVATGGLCNVCDEVVVSPGEYFIWVNDTSGSAIIEPDPANPDFWPLPGQNHVVEANGWSTVQMPESAMPGKTYSLLVTFEGGGPCPQDGQPKIIVSSGFPLPR